MLHENWIKTRRAFKKYGHFESSEGVAPSKSPPLPEVLEIDRTSFFFWQTYAVWFGQNCIVKGRVRTVDISQAKRESCKNIIYEILLSNPA